MTERHPTNAEIELFAIGADEEITFPNIASHLADCDACAELLVREGRLEETLTEVAANTRFCPGCERVSRSERCDHCGVAHAPGGFIVERVLVQSGHGRLYLATDPVGRRVALKELVFTQIPNAQALVAFEKEAKLLQELEHPGVPRFVSSFSEGDGVHTRLYLAQEFVEGASLMARLSSHRFTEEEARDIAHRVLEILEYLHCLNPKIIHRDIKPANILQRSDGTVVLVDFGSARDFSMTGGATLVGTFGYIPPEQLIGMADETSDLYGLGASLAHLLTRRPPWQLGQSRRGLEDLNVTPALRKFVAKLMAPDPSERFPNAAEARRALDRRAEPFPIRRLMPMAAIVAAAIASAAALGVLAGDAELTPAQRAPVAEAPERSRRQPLPEVDESVPEPEPEPEPQPVDYVDDVDDVDNVDQRIRAPSRDARARLRADIKARDLFARGTKALLAGRLSNAKERLTECIEAAPNFADCHRQLGVLYAQLDDISNSILHYRHYVRLKPNAPDAGRVRKLIRDFEEGGGLVE